jgi:biopolymer transport protein ExbD
MPIVEPGKRPAPRFEKSKVFGGKMGGGRRPTDTTINVVPMVDMMTMLVIFLLQQFSATGEVIFMQKDIKLPEAKNGQSIEPAPVVAISATQVLVSDKKVADVADLDRDPGYLNIPGVEEQLREQKKRWDFMHQQDPDRDKKWTGQMIVQADKKIPFRLVKRVMFSANQVGYFNINFATLEASGVQDPNAKPGAAGGTASAE